jgi:hypothetical protein
MSTPKRFTDAIHIGTGEFSFCAGAATLADTRPPAGFRDVGNVDVYQLQIENETYQREGAYRGKKAVDASFSIKQSLSYLIRCDELTKDNLLIVAMGTDLSDNTRTALDDTAADVMRFKPGAASDSRYWYDLLISGEQQTFLDSALVFGGTPVAATTQDTGDTFTKNGHGLADGDRVILVTLTTTTGASLLTPYYVVNADTNTFKLSATAGGSALALTTDGNATYLKALVEGTEVEIDLEVGRIRLLSAMTTNVYSYLSAAEIDSDSDNYAKSISPLQEASFEGYGRLCVFHAKDEKLTWEHRDFSCSITPANNQESTGKTPSMFDFIVKITHDRGRLFAGKRTIND